MTPTNQCERDRLLTFSGDNVGADGRVGYMSQTSQSSSRRGNSGVIVKDMKVVLNRSTNHNFSMLEKVLMALGEVDISLGPALLPSIIQVTMVICRKLAGLRPMSTSIITISINT